jgi:hypothetical protein
MNGVKPAETVSRISAIDAKKSEDLPVKAALRAIETVE